jgi:hypothetical protein
METDITTYIHKYYYLRSKALNGANNRNPKAQPINQATNEHLLIIYTDSQLHPIRKLRMGSVVEKN